MNNKRREICSSVIVLMILLLYPSSILASSGNSDLKASIETPVVNDESKGIPISTSLYNESNFEYFNDVTWIQREGVWSLSISPKSFVRRSFSIDILMKSWDELKKKFSNDIQWSQYKENEDVLFEQYKCHFFKAKLKEYWNIEPYRESIDGLCN